MPGGAGLIAVAIVMGPLYFAPTFRFTTAVLLLIARGEKQQAEKGD
jgi:hypothetical protein